MFVNIPTKLVKVTSTHKVKITIPLGDGDNTTYASCILAPDKAEALAQVLLDKSDEARRKE